MMVNGADYVSKANDTVVTLAMVETAEALEKVEAVEAARSAESAAYPVSTAGFGREKVIPRGTQQMLAPVDRACRS